MLRMLRSDLYRLVRLSQFWVGLAACAGIALISVSAATVVGSLPSALQGVPRMTGLCMVVPLASGVCATSLVVSDSRERAVRSLGSVPGCRRWYVPSKYALLVGVSTLYALTVCAIQLVGLATLGMPFEPFGADAYLLGFAGVVLVSVAWATVPLLVACSGGSEGLSAVLALACSTSLADMAAATFLGALAVALPAAEPLLRGIDGLLVLSSATLLDDPATLLSSPSALARAVAVPLLWVAVMLPLAHAVMCRRAL